MLMVLGAVPFSAVSLSVQEPGTNNDSDDIYPNEDTWPALTDSYSPAISIHLKAATFDPLMEEAQIPNEWRLGSGNDYYIVQCTGPVLSHWSLDIKATGAVIVGYIPEYAYIAYMREEAKDAVEELPYIRWVGPYHPGYKMSPSLTGLTGEVELNVLAFSDREGNIPLVTQRLKSLGGTITHTGEDNNILRVKIQASKIKDIAFIPEVEYIDAYMPPVRFMDNIRGFTGANNLHVGGFDGTGVVGEVKDTGIDQNHPDLAPQLIGTEGSPDDKPHGTAVFGIVFSTGLNDGQAKGMIPGAEGVFCDWQVDRGISVRHLVENWDGVFQTNSWGSLGWDGEYTMLSQENDNAVFVYDVTMLYSAGNSDLGVHSESTSQDSSAKNVICVGGLWHLNNTDRGDDVWVAMGPGGTPSQGPAADGRVKPDISGPFDAIYTTDSVDGDGENGYSTGNYTADFGGTSGAAPVVAGSVGLVYQMFKENHFGNNPGGDVPHAATVKAILIADAYQYDFTQADRYQQGWGGVDVGNVYNIGQDHLIVDEPTPLQTGESTLYSISPTGVGPLKISLVWTDYPASSGADPALVNDLDLKVTDPDGNIYWGNNGLLGSKWSSTGGSPDTLNNVENVFIETPLTTNWTIEVIAQNVPQDGYPPSGFNDQIYSLVASNAVPMVAINITYPYYAEMINDIVTVTGTAFEEAVSVEMKIDNGIWQTVTGTTDWSYIWDTKTYSDGPHMLYARAYNGVAYSYVKDVPVFIDNTPPDLMLTVVGPSYYDNLTWFVVNSTEFLLSADDGTGSGVSGIWYNIFYEGSEVVPWTQGSTFYLTWGEGNYSILYYCSDNLGNINGTVVLQAFADARAPVTFLDVGPPRFRSTANHYWNVTIDTMFSFSDIIEASSVDFSWYFVDSDFYQGSSFDLKDYVSGTHTITWGSQDVFGHNESAHSIMVTLDRNSPSTIYNFGQPRYRGSVIDSWNVTDTTPFSLVSTDDYAGVNFTWYSIDGVFFSGTSFTLAGNDDGLHYVEWGAVDNLGNNKTDSSATHYLDSNPPVTNLSMGEPKYRLSEDDLWNVTQETPFFLSAYDQYAGVAATWYVVNGVYGEGAQFTLAGLPDMKYVIKWGSLDQLGQNETAKEITVQLDASPPKTNISIQGPNFRHHVDSVLNITQNTSFSLAASDKHSGSAQTWYTINDDTFEGSIFNLSNYPEDYYTIAWGSSDNLGNAESSNILNVYLNILTPKTAIDIGEPTFRKKALHQWNVTDTTTFTLTPLWLHSGNSAVWFTIDGEYRTGETFTLAGFSEGLHDITWGVRDNLGHNESGNLLAVYLDLGAPYTQMDIGEPKYRADSGDNWAVNADTVFSLLSMDNCSGVLYSWYIIDGIFYQGTTFSLYGHTDGPHTISWGGTDRLGHNETAHLITVLLDDTHPEMVLHIGSPNQVFDGVTHITSDTPITFTIVDGGVDNSIVLYSLNSGTVYTHYSGPFTVTFSSNSILYYGEDILGNRGDDGSLSIVVNDNDYDSDGLKDLEDEDDDNDGLPDSQEDVNQNNIQDAGETDPLNPDSDGDSYNDLADAFPLDKDKWNGDGDTQFIIFIGLVIFIVVVLFLVLLSLRKSKDMAEGVFWLDEDEPEVFRTQEETGFKVHEDDKTPQWHHEEEARLVPYEGDEHPEWEGEEDTQFGPEEEEFVESVEEPEFEPEGDTGFVPMEQEDEPGWEHGGDSQLEPEGEDTQFEAAEKQTEFEPAVDEEHAQFEPLEDEGQAGNLEESEFEPAEDDVDFELEEETEFELHEHEEEPQWEESQEKEPRKKEKKPNLEDEGETEFELD
jgi:hypothetical protein